MIKRIVLLSMIGLFCIPILVSAQTSKDTLVASQYYKKADSIYSVRELEKSIKFFRKSLSLYQEAKVWEKVVDCYIRIATSHIYLHDLEKSYENAQIALKICSTYLPEYNKEKALTYDILGQYNEEVSDFTKALLHYEKALYIRQKILPEDHRLLSHSYNSIGIVYARTGDYKKSITYQKKALDIKIKLFGADHHKTGVNYSNIASSYNNLGIYDKAIEFYEKEMAVTKNKYGEDHIYIAFNYSNLANVYSSIQQNEKALKYYKKASEIFKNNNEILYSAFLDVNIGKLYSDIGNDEEALLYYERALPTSLKSYGKKHTDVIRIIQNIGVSHENRGDYSKSLQYHERALSICLSAFGKNHPLTADSFFNLGRYYVKKKEYEVGLKYYNKCLASLETNTENSKQYIAETYNSMAAVYSEKKEFKKSLIYYDKSLVSNNKSDVISKNNINVYNVNEYLDVNVLLKTVAGKAKTLLDLYQHKKNVEDLYKSSVMFQNTDSVVNYIRQSLYTYNDKVRFSKNVKKIYKNALQTEISLHKDKQDKESLNRTFYYAEKSKSNTLKELLTESNAKNFAGLPTGLLELEQKLKNKHALYLSKITEEWSEETTDTIAIYEYENELFDISIRYDSLIEILEEKHPKYYQLKHKNTVVSAESIQQKLSDNATVLEFFTSDSTTYAFTITKNKIAVKELVTPKLAKKVENFNQSINSENIVDYKELAYTLYQELVVPVKEKLIGDELIIIPDGPLWHLNFDLLLTQNNTKSEARDMSYLLRDYAISYANSANLLFNSFKDKHSSFTIRNECLAFSFSDSTKLTTSKTMSLATLRDAGDDLPGTRKEIKAISNIIDGQYYYGSEAIEANFKQNAGQYSILHLALHGDVDHKNPQNSKLYFTKNKDTIEDNYLYSHELFALDIPAELAVLSACNTGMGTIAKGEGIMSLGNAFQYAGTKSLLLSGWEVSDKSAPILIENFYKNLANGMSKSKALQKAKLDFLKKADFDQVAPFYWGSFYLLGNNDPIDMDRPLHINMYWIILACALIVLILTFVYYRRRIK